LSGNPLINNIVPNTGRFYKEDGNVANLADLINTISTNIALIAPGGTGGGVYGIETKTRPDNTIAYAIGDVVGADPATNWEFTNFGVIGQKIIILKAILQIHLNAVPSGMGGFTFHLFNSAPTAITDNSAYNLISADRTKSMGYIDFDVPKDKGDTLITQVENLNAEVIMTGTSLFGVLETLGAYTPTSQVVKSIQLLGVIA
jgi:hypothetical protein